MEKVEIHTEIDIQKLLSQLKTSQLQAFSREISALIRRRQATDVEILEARLLQQLNEACVLSPEHWAEFNQLTKKRESEPMTDQELARLAQLIQEEERLRLQRIQLLGELAELKRISLPELTQKLGITSSQSA